MAEKISEKKLVSRNVAIGLVLICIVLSAGFIGVIAYYLSMANNYQSQITEKDSTIASLNSQVSSLQANLNQSNLDIAARNSQISDLQTLITQYQQTLSDYGALLALAKSGLLVSELPAPMVANSTFPVWNNVVDYAGYVVINVQSSSNTTYAGVIYTSSVGVTFNSNTTVGTSGAAAFPVLPGPIAVFVGNTESTDNVTATVTATYHY